MQVIESWVRSACSKGLGLRRDFIKDLLREQTIPLDFLEIAPENWIGMGGQYAEQLHQIAEKVPLTCHGLSLNLGGMAPLDMDYLHQLKKFFQRYDIVDYTEHLSFCGDSGHLYDLLPLPFNEESVKKVSARIRQAQDVLERRIGIENISFYALPSNEMTEAEFVSAVVQEADCGLLLDVNNTYVNAHNHGYDAYEFIKAMPTERIHYLHVAGHDEGVNALKIDTHGEDVNEGVWRLLSYTYECHGLQPTLLERDFNIPALEQLLTEVSEIERLQHQYFNESQMRSTTELSRKRVS
ncbi:MAG: DUF692 domain-containing protein [Thiotrichales bacterium]|nr:DUF692 domain-containing protein [Thiotrichales bacterium]